MKNKITLTSKSVASGCVLESLDTEHLHQRGQSYGGPGVCGGR